LNVAVTEQVGTLDRRERATSTDVEVGNIAVVKPDWDQPWFVRAAQSQLVDRQVEFVALVTLLAGEALTGEARDEDKRVVRDRLPNP